MRLADALELPQQAADMRAVLCGVDFVSIQATETENVRSALA